MIKGLIGVWAADEAASRSWFHASVVMHGGFNVKGGLDLGVLGGEEGGGHGGVLLCLFGTGANEVTTLADL